MIDPNQDIKNRIQMATLTNWILGCVVIFVVGCVTYAYVGPVMGIEGEAGFQVTGMLVGAIIAHYSHRTLKTIKEIGEDDV